jgi:hypothetical protein
MKTLHQSWSTMGSFFQDKQLSFASWGLLLLSGILLFVYSLPHVIALRKLLLLIAFLISFKYFWNALLKKPKPLLSAVLIFVLLQVWMLVIAGFISDQPYSSFSEWKGQWLPALMSFVVGIGLAYTLTQAKIKNPLVTVAMIISIPITIFLCVNAIALIHNEILTSSFPLHQLGITDQKFITNYLIALLEPIIIADLYYRLVKGNRLLPVPGWVILAIFILVLFSLFAASSRNGLIIMFLTFVLGAGMMISEIRKVYSPQKIVTSVLATLIFVLAIALVSFKTDPRWKNFIETVPIAWDIDHDLTWLNGDDDPSTPKEKQAVISEYIRIAWAHEGLRLMMEHTWGTEISRHTFHNLVLEKYGHANIPQSENGWIDFGLNVGIPGLIVWSWFLLLLTQLGWQTWRIQKEPIGLAFAVMVIMFAVRGLLDPIFQDHELEQFMMVAGLLSGTLSFGKTNISQTHVETG